MKILKPFLAVLLIFAVMTLTACPKAPKTLRTLRETSGKLNIYGSRFIQANIDARDAKEISPELFADLTAGTRVYVNAVNAYRAGLTEAESVVNNTQTLPTGTVDKLQKLLDVAETAFINLTVKLKLVTGSQAATIQAIIASVQLAITTLRGVLADTVIPVTGNREATV